MSKKHLGVEFYRNFVGIEKPLRVYDPTYRSSDSVYSEIGIEARLDCLYKDKVLAIATIDGGQSRLCYHYFDTDNKHQAFKPYLRTIEDLSDEELLNIFIGSDVFKIPFIIIKRDENSVNFFSHNTTNHVCGWDFNTGNLILKEFFDIQGIQNRLAEKHCHLKAKEYIDNGLALRVEK